jgi:hypothetical protein
MWFGLNVGIFFLGRMLAFDMRGNFVCSPITRFEF